MSIPSLVAIPDDVIILVMYFLEARDLASLECTCKALYHLVEEYGWNIVLKRNPRLSYSLQKSYKFWSTKDRVRYNTIADEHWARGEFIARPLSNKWAGKLQPVLAINSSRLLLAAGNKIYSYGFYSSSSSTRAPPVYLECIYSTSNTGGHPNLDIRSLVCVPDDGLDRTIYVGYANGIVERLVLPVPDGHDLSAPLDVSLEESFNFHVDDVTESLSASSTHLLTLSSSGSVAYFPLQDSHTSAQFLHLNSRSWSSYLSARSSSPYAAFGSSSMNPLEIHDILPTGLSSTPSTFLASFASDSRPSAVYAIDAAPIGSPLGSSDQIIISGWYDGFINVHDLRTPSRTSTTQSTNPEVPSLAPVLHFADPWSFEPIYSLSSGGGSAAHIAAGSARHSVVAFFDVRASSKGWSVHAPGNDSSPVYSVIMDGARVFGANQSRGFVLDFGPGVYEDTYPPITAGSTPATRGLRRRSEESLRRLSKNPAGFYVTKYSHNRARGW